MFYFQKTEELTAAVVQPNEPCTEYPESMLTNLVEAAASSEKATASGPVQNSSQSCGQVSAASSADTEVETAPTGTLLEGNLDTSDRTTKDCTPASSDVSMTQVETEPKLNPLPSQTDCSVGELPTASPKFDSCAPVSAAAGNTVSTVQRSAAVASVISRAKREIIVVDLGSDDDVCPPAVDEKKVEPSGSPKQQISKGLKRPAASMQAVRPDSEAAWASKRLHGASPKKSQEPEKADSFMTSVLSAGSTVSHHNKVSTSKDKDKDRCVKSFLKAFL
jgi:hypothetical protein